MTSPTADPPRTLQVRRLDVELSVPEVVRALRHQRGLAVLVGDWGPGEAVICWDPVRAGHDEDPFDLPVPALAEPVDEFCGGWLGVWGYQLGSRLERLPDPPPRPFPLTAARLAYYDFALVLRDGVWSFNDHAEETRRAAVERAHATVLDLTAGAAEAYGVGTFRATPDPQAHAEAVAAVREHIAAGDLFQANVCLRLEATFAGDPLDAFLDAWAATEPAHGAFLRTPDGDLASLSPELFLRRVGRDVVTSPIKGTAPLDTDPAALAASAKDRAENIMIVDLMRNDLSRVCEPGSVRVPESHRLERHAVWHLVSDVEGRLADTVRDADLLRATFPPGSVTGAPKIRAMEIIAEVEATGREAYTGALGYGGPSGLELSVLIRTFEFAQGRLWLGVGGGIVIDSDPDGEVAECFTKAEPLVAALDSVIDRAGWDPGPPPGEEIVVPPQISVQPDPQQGVFTTMLVVDGRIRDAGAHRGRLQDSGNALGLDVARAWSRAEQVAAGLSGRHRLRIDVVPGDDPEVRAAPLEGSEAEPWALTAATLPEGWGGHKWRDREVIDHDDYLFVDQDATLLEANRAAVFVVRDEGVYTPPLDGRILPSTMRHRVIARLRDHGIDVHELAPRLAGIAEANEVFCANAVRGVVPVTSVDPYGRWPVGRLTRWLQSAIDLGDPAEPAQADPSSILEVGGQDLGSIRAAGGQDPVSILEARRRSLERIDPTPQVLLIDNYDSFVYNLAHDVAVLGAGAEVVRNDAVTVDELVARAEAGRLTHLIISPGPGEPEAAGISVEAVRRLGPLIPVLGVCLGHQAIGEAFGARTVRSERALHGTPSIVWHDGAGLYRDLPDPVVAARYHSLVTDDLPDELTVTARTASGVIMGIRHRDWPIEGIQAHPESVLTRQGRLLIANFLVSGSL